MFKSKIMILTVLMICMCAVLSACGSNSNSVSSKAPEAMPTPVFTNHKGTADTICKKEGCTKHIAEYGDTLYCPEHSEKCILCGTYINEGEILCGWCSNSPGYEDKSENTYGQSYYAKIFQSPSPSSFTNKFGTPTTRCTHPGCNNYIASSGDTNCCVKHSNKCASCGCYIDEDASFCMDCIEKALNH